MRRKDRGESYFSVIVEALCVVSAIVVLTYIVYLAGSVLK